MLLAAELKKFRQPIKSLRKSIKTPFMHEISEHYRKFSLNSMLEETEFKMQKIFYSMPYMMQLLRNYKSHAQLRDCCMAAQTWI